ncbi:unnamed protein product [Paramecium primaurelia]|uniref:ABC transporter domain-containing protein n=1 Tax=Paramecium primaurelia TaxID=5886 RepID=A0A8S1K4E3_PARPR|nr:unnamed protein product [Paramecium primaurelia]
MQSFRNKEYISDLTLPLVTAIIVSQKDQLEFLGFIASLFLSIAVSTPTRFKESQKNMGMKQRSYLIGWILYGYIKTMMNTISLIFFLWLLTLIINDGDLWISYKIIQNIFSVFIEYLNSSLFYYCMSIFPQSSISFIYMSALKKGLFNSKLQVQLINYIMQHCKLGIESFLYFLLFFICIKYFQMNMEIILLLGLFGKSKKWLQQYQKLNIWKKYTVSIKNLTKKFGEFKAVDNLTIQLYEQQILCLQGHNGAGKTTTINMLTGMIQKTKGTIILM